MQKRGISTIITTVIMIVLVLVAVGVVWAIVQNILTESADDISLGALKIRLNIEKVKVTEAGVDVQVKRSAGEANLVGINFIISDGENTEVFEEETTMKQLATKTFSLPYLGVVKSVEIAPVLESESGKEKVGNVVDKEEIIKEVMEIDLTIEEIIIIASDLNIQVTRNIGEANLVGINFIISNGEVTETFEKETTMEEETTETFSLSYDDFVESVEIAPVFETREGEIKIGNVVDKETFTIKQILENLGAVSWWRFEGNAQDEIGGNHGEIVGDVNFVDGEYGRATSFDGVDDYIFINNLNYNTAGQINEITICAWFNVEPSLGGWSIIDFDRSEYFNLEIGWNDRSTNVVNFATTDSGISTNDHAGTINVRDGDWHFTCGIYDNLDKIIYVDGDEDNRVANPHNGLNLGTGVTRYGFIGDGSEAEDFNGLRNNLYFNGLIDEVMIFNKALTEGQVKALYELDLN